MKPGEKQEAAYWSLLGRSRDYRNLWLGGMISLFGDQLNHVASILITLSITDGSSVSAGVIVGVRFVLKMLGGNVGGVLADRHDRRFLLILLDVIMAILALSYIIAGRLASVWLLFGITALMGGANAVFSTTRMAIIPDLVGKESLTQAFGLSQFSVGIAMIFGYAMGGAVVGFCGYETAFVINGLTFLISAAFTWKVKTPQQREMSQRSQAGRPFLGSEFISGLRYLFGRPFLLKMILLDLAWALGGGGVFVIVAMHNFQQLGNSEQTLGLIYSMAGVGALLATLVCPWIGRHFKRDVFLLGASCLLEGALFSVLVFHSNPVGVALLFGMQSTVSFVFGLIYGPLLINSVSDTMRGRVIGFEEGLFLPLYGLSSALYGFMLSRMDLTLVGLVSGGIMMLAGTVWLAAMAGGYLFEKDPALLRQA